MAQNIKKLSGVFAAVVTPFASDELAPDDLRFNLRKLGKTNLTGYVALGSNGEVRSLTDNEQAKVLEVFAEAKTGKIIIVGTACESTKQTIEKSRMASAMGFDYVAILTPSYFAKRIDGSVLRDYYQRIADSVDVPVLLYNAPGFAGGVRIPPQTVVELASHPNIAGMKDSAPEGPARFLTCLNPTEDFHVLAGSANFFYPSLHLGATGGVLSLANVLPAECCDLYRLFIEGKYDEARALIPIRAVKAYYTLGRAYEESGWRDKAIEQYGIFLDIWKDADSGIPALEDARQRLTRLNGGT